MNIMKPLWSAASLSLAAVVLMAGSAFGATPSPSWTLDSFAVPTSFSEAEDAFCSKNLGSAEISCDAYRLTAMNVGSEPTDGSQVTLDDTLPAGVTARKVEFFTGQGNTAENHAAEDCTGAGKPKPTEPLRCTFSGVAPPDETLRMFVYVTVAAEAVGPLVNTGTVSGGGASTASAESSNPVGATSTPFGVTSFDFFKDSVNGQDASQAGAHPYELITTIDLNTDRREGDFMLPEFESPEDVKDVVVDLPLGFVGSTLAAPECTLAELSSEQGCAPDTIVGHLFTEPEDGATNIAGPIYNIVPEHGYPAEFGYVDALHGAHVFYTHVVPTAQGYVLQTTAKEIPQVPLSLIVATFYGDPASRDNTTSPQIPFFTNPTACSNGPQVASIWIDSWQHPARFNGDGLPADLSEAAWSHATSQSPAVTGCNALQFTPELGAQPTTHEADKPSGLEFGLKLAQSETVGTDATPALKNIRVLFPEGMSVDPSAADGLGVCSETQIGWQGPGLFDFTPDQPECPESSKIGSLELETPLIPGKIYGEVFLAAQNANPFGSTFATYVVVNDPLTGVVLKIAGELKLDPQTGRIAAVFDENPQLPFADLQLHFFGGPRAELATPSTCGTYTSTSEMEPWSFPDSGPFSTPSDTYVIDEDCQAGFKPAFIAGSTNLQGGAYTTFQASFSREDNENELAGATVNLPPGMLANIAGVPECSEAQIHETEQSGIEKCPADSQVGTVTAGAGPGPNPLFVHGKVFFTGPYNGGPFGLAVVVPAKPGPFDFGLVVVRQSLRIDPLTAAVTDVSDPFPTILDVTGASGHTDGIPIRLRRVDVEINRPGFTFNPTNCDKLAVAAAVTARQGQSSKFAVPFQITNCAALAFKPTFTASTSAHTSRKDGASLHVSLSYPKGALGADANVRYVKVELPKALPSELKTLKLACLGAVFDANPAGCRAESIVGHAVVHTEILSVPLEGPAYFVSRGTKWPELIIVLQGDGITVDLHGETFINRKGITSSTFASNPDTPFEDFELTLPEGPYSALASNLPKKAKYSFCGQKLTMPTTIIGQNGAEIKQKTKIRVTGCKTGKHKHKRNKHHKVHRRHEHNAARRHHKRKR